MGPLIDRKEFRQVVKEIVKCLRQNLDKPGLAPLTPEQVMFWLQSVTLDDLQAVMQALEAEGSSNIH
jgi:hypothetical protein